MVCKTPSDDNVAAYTNARYVKLARPQGPQRRTPVKVGVQRTVASACARAIGPLAERQREGWMRFLASGAGGERRHEAARQLAGSDAPAEVGGRVLPATEGC